MTFTTPLYLLMLLAIPVLVLLHFVRRQRRVRTISSIYLWSEVKREFRKRFLLHRLLRNFLLIAQIVVILASAIALAGPRIPTAARSGNRNYVVIVDTSASMAAVSRGESRLLRAQHILADFLSGLSARSRVTVVSAGGGVQLITPGSVGPGDAIEAITDLKATASTGSMDGALLQAVSLASDLDSYTMLVATDGAFDDDIPRLPGNVEFIDVSDEEENAGITAFSFRTPPNRSSNYELLVRIETHFGRPVDARVTITVDGNIEYDSQHRLIPGRTETIVTPYNGIAPTTAVARIDIEDALGQDNTAFLVFDPDVTMRVLMVSRGNAFLRQALSVYPNLELEISEDDSSKEEYDLVMYDRITPVSTGSGRFVFIGSIPPELAGEIVTRSRQNPPISGWVQRHPLVEGISPSEFTIFSDLGVPRTGAPIESVIHSNQYSLLWTYHEDGTEAGDIDAVGLSFDITASDLPLRTDFPVLIANIIAWLSSRDSGSGYSIRGGAVLEGTIGQGETVSIHRPDGSLDTIEAGDDGFSYTRTDLAGFYRARSDSRETLFAVNILSPEETNVTRRSDIFARGIRLTDASAVDSGGNEDYPVTPGLATRDATAASERSAYVDRRDIWRVFAVIALILLSIEWALWLRREAV